MALHSIAFAIPEELVVAQIPEKQKAFAQYEPGQGYAYSSEQEYYQGYQEAHYAVTTKKAGWDCLRHYEILANGCIPYFVDLVSCPSGTLSSFPKELVWEAMQLPGVNFVQRQIDFTIFNIQRYQELLQQLLDWSRHRLTTKAMAREFLRKCQLTTTAKVLFLSGEITPDYQRCLLLHGLRSVLGCEVVDFPRVDHLYQDYPVSLPLYGKGFTYARRLDPSIVIDRKDLVTKIANHHYDLVVYGSVHRGTPLLEEVRATYQPSEIVFVCGEDLHQCEHRTNTRRQNPLFLREF